MSRIKVVPHATPNADGRWIECPFDLPSKSRWRHIESMVAALVPDGHAVVAVECGPRGVTELSQAVLPFRKIEPAA
jgi:hypothetical protein